MIKLIIIMGLSIGVNLHAFTQTYKQIPSYPKIQASLDVKIIQQQKLDVNNISAFFRNNGEFYSNYINFGPGFEWPKGSDKFAIFSAGLWIGAKYKDTDTTESIRVAVSGHFGSEYRPGLIDKETGLPDDYTKPEYKIYKVRPLLDNPNSNPDYYNWPVNQGAPWVDINKNGVWEPDIDKIGIEFHNGITFPDMILYYVYNDADPAWHNLIGGSSKPLGVEVHKTAWAYNALPNVQFLRFQIYNKSARPWDSVYVGLWSDPDLGNPFDDFAGCDIRLDSRGKRHDLGYCYNATNYDESIQGYGDKPPAVGFKLLKSSNQVEHLTGFKVYKEIFSDKPIQAYYHLRDTVFMCSDDPVADSTWIDPPLWEISDVRFLMAHGPFNMTPGDSQDIIFASLIEQGTDRLNSITKLRKTSSDLRYIFDKGIGRVLGNLEVTSNYYKLDSTKIFIKATLTDANSIEAKLYRKADNFETNFQLYDDGMHNDGAPNDGTFGNIIEIPPHPELTQLSLIVNYKDGETITFDSIKQLSTSGPVKVVDFKIISDNLNSDGEANPGENIRCLFGLKNYARDTLNNFTINIYPIDNQILRKRTPDIRYIPHKIGYNNSVSIDSNNYISFDINPKAVIGAIAKVMFEISDSYYNVWYDTIGIEIKKPIFPTTEVMSKREAGESEGSFGVRIIDPSKLKNNIYNITVLELDSINIVFDLKNTSTNEILLLNHPLPDELGYNIPVTDGFKITRGTTTTKKGLKRWEYTPSSNIWFNGVKGFTADIYKPQNNYGFIAYPQHQNFIYMPSGLPIDSLRYVMLEFSTTNIQKAYRYIDGFAPFPPVKRRIIHPEFRPFVKDSVSAGFSYQDYEKYRLGIDDSGYVVPFTVWECDSKGKKLRQLDVGIVERNDSLYRWVKTSPTDSIRKYLYYGNIDGRWKPSPMVLIDGSLVVGRRGDEFILIFGTTYTDSPKVMYTGGTTSTYIPHFNLLDSFDRIPVMYAVMMRQMNEASDFKDGDVLRIYPYYPLRHGDVFSFNPIELKEEVVPSNYRLTQNYPNPFNAGTTIQYGIPHPGQVTLDVFNILGERVITLINNEHHDEGNYTISWDGITSNGRPAASGVYFYRISVIGQQGSFAQTKKMVVLK